MTIVDFADGIVGYLRAYGEINDLAAGRVYAAELPASEAANMPRYAVVVTPAGGAGPHNQRAVRPRIDVTCYGATPQQARLLWLAADRALQDLDRSVYAGVLLHSATPIYGPVATRHPETHWPLSWGSWQLTASTETAY